MCMMAHAACSLPAGEPLLTIWMRGAMPPHSAIESSRGTTPALAKEASAAAAASCAATDPKSPVILAVSSMTHSAMALAFTSASWCSTSEATWLRQLAACCCARLLFAWKRASSGATPPDAMIASFKSASPRASSPSACAASSGMFRESASSISGNPCIAVASSAATLSSDPPSAALAPRSADNALPHSSCPSRPA